MSFVSALLDSGKVHNFEQAFGAKDITSSEMQAAIREWHDLYYQRVKTEDEDPCQRIPVAIVNKITKTAFSEYSATTAKDAGGAEYTAAILTGLEAVRKKAMQNALIGGVDWLKPLLHTGKSVGFNVITRGNVLPLALDAAGQVSSIGTAEQTRVGGVLYTLLERRTVDERGYLTIENKLFASKDAKILGKEVPLSALAKYDRLVPKFTYSEPLHSLGLIPIRTPLENCVDGSHDPVSVYAPAVGLIHNINRNEAQLNGEFERGESRIITSADMLEPNENGDRKLKDHVFVGLDDDISAVGVTIFSPALREQSFLARKREYLRNAESLIGLKRGLLSEVEAEERTAKEVTSSEGDYNLTIIDFQEMWEDAVREAVRVCEILGRLYKIYTGPAIDPQKDVVIDWGNGVLYDEDKTWADYMAMVAAGMLRTEIALAWKFNLPWETPEDLAKIREKYMPELETMVGGEE